MEINFSAAYSVPKILVKNKKQKYYKIFEKFFLRKSEQGLVTLGMEEPLQFIFLMPESQD